MRFISACCAQRCVIHVACLLCLSAAFSVALSQSYPPQGYPPQGYPGYPTGYPPQPYPYPYPQVPPIGSTPAQTPALPEYRVPVIIVAAPASGATLPDDKPVVVLRFATYEPLDPIDALTLSVTVDGRDRTSLFQLAQGEAWGRLAAPSELLTAGQHDVAARICTARGECGTTKATVTIVSSASLLQLATSRSAEKAKQKKTKILDAVLQAARVLIH